ncbi:Uncharacterised protein [Porphyromonas cangingivalis]|nr:Uncharacterised protein [Porphyromonas cangingivalis]
MAVTPIICCILDNYNKQHKIRNISHFALSFFLNTTTKQDKINLKYPFRSRNSRPHTLSEITDNIQ